MLGTIEEPEFDERLDALIFSSAATTAQQSEHRSRAKVNHRPFPLPEGTVERLEENP